MSEDIHLPTVAGSLLVVAGAFHLAVGAAALAERPTLLPALLAAWGVLALGGTAVAASGGLRRRSAYLGGLVLVTVSLLGYLDVYALGVSETLLGVEWQPPVDAHDHGGQAHSHDHGWGTEPTVTGRLADSHLALPSKLVELAALASLVVLLRRE